MAIVKAMMAGSVWKVLVKPGDPVRAGQEVVVLESMKMEIPQEAESAGIVREIAVSQGQFVNEGDLLVRLEEGES